MTTRSKKTTLMMIVCGVMLGISEWVFADDLNPPPWTRSGASNRSTSAEWDFVPDEGGNLPNPLFPDGASVPLIVGDFAPVLDAAFPCCDPHPSGFANDNLTFTGSGFLNEGTAVFPISFNIPNWIDLEPIKFLRLQVTYTGATPTTQVTGFLGVPGDSTLVSESLVDTFIGEGYFYQDWELQPNPDWEQVAIFLPPGTFVDQVVIDTISTTPEPSTVVLGAMGMLAIGRIARRRRVR